MSDAQSISSFVRAERVHRGWTQNELATSLDVSVDSIRTLESGSYALPRRPRKGGHLLDRLAAALGLDVCEIVRSCFDEAQISTSHYRRCLQPAKPTPDLAGTGSLHEYVHALPKARDALTAYAALLNAHAVAFVIHLEKEFDTFEFLLTNQPPFMLFADDEYITTGSSSVELSPADRRTYHQILFEHRANMRHRVKQGIKHYRVVLHKHSLIDFLGARSKQRALRVVNDMKSFLRFRAFDLVILDSSDPLEEFEVLSCNYPFRINAEGDSVSIRHRRIGIGNTNVYQPAIVGTRLELVVEDYTRAESLWKAGMSQTERQPPGYSEYLRDQLHLKHRRVAARLLDDALSSAQPLL